MDIPVQGSKTFSVESQIVNIFHLWGSDGLSTTSLQLCQYDETDFRQHSNQKDMAVF